MIEPSAVAAAVAPPARPDAAATTSGKPSPVRNWPVAAPPGEITPILEFLDAAETTSGSNRSLAERVAFRRPVPDSTRLHDAILLGVAIFVWVLAAALIVRPDQTVALWITPEEPLPESCLTRAALGVSCPACGLTRSFIHLAHGRWQASFDRHPLGWLIALLVLFQIPYRTAAVLGWPVWRPSEKLFSRSALALGCVFLVVWISRTGLNWLVA